MKEIVQQLSYDYAEMFRPRPGKYMKQVKTLCVLNPFHLMKHACIYSY